MAYNNILLNPNNRLHRILEHARKFVADTTIQEAVLDGLKVRKVREGPNKGGVHVIMGIDILVNPAKMSETNLNDKSIRNPLIIKSPWTSNKVNDLKGVCKSGLETGRDGTYLWYSIKEEEAEGKGGEEEYNDDAEC